MTLKSSDGSLKISEFRLDCAFLAYKQLARSSHSFLLFLWPIKFEPVMYLSRVARFFKLAQQRTKAQGTRLHVFPTDAFGGQFLVFWRMRRVQ